MVYKATAVYATKGPKLELAIPCCTFIPKQTEENTGMSSPKKETISYTHKALVEMRLNHRARDFIKVILDPTDGSDMSGLPRHVHQALSRQGVSREWRQRQELPRLPTLFGGSQLRYIVGHPNYWSSRSRTWRSNPGVVPHRKKEALAFM